MPASDTGYAYAMKLSSAGLSGRYTAIVAIWIAFLLVMHWAGVYFSHGGVSAWSDILALFDLDREWNVPTFTNSALLTVCGLISLRLAVQARRRIQKIGWILSSIFFIYLAMDELFIIHEQLAEPIRKLLNIGNSNPLYHAWVVPAFAVITLLVSIIQFIHAYYRDLKVFTGLLKLVVIMATGVVMLEILGTLVYDNSTVYRVFMVPAEEIFELSMAATILHYLADKIKYSRHK